MAIWKLCSCVVFTTLTLLSPHIIQASNKQYCIAVGSVQLDKTTHTSTQHPAPETTISLP